MWVWIVETGSYENRGVSGVYASREAAIAAHPIPSNYAYPEKPTASNASRRGGWRPNNPEDPDNCSWSNGLDWDAAADVYPMEVKGAVDPETTTPRGNLSHPHPPSDDGTR